MDPDPQHCQKHLGCLEDTSPGMGRRKFTEGLDELAYPDPLREEISIFFVVINIIFSLFD